MADSDSTASINKRSDDAAWPTVHERLKAGASLGYDTFIQRAGTLEGQTIGTMIGPTIGRSRLHRLVREGVLVQTGVHRYALTEGKGEP